METLRRTSLYHKHLELGAKLMPFAGWELPLQYAGIVAEHQAVRRSAGLFDVSHMGEIFVSGAGAETALNYLTCNDVSALSNGKAHYSAILNDSGGVVDDIIVYRFSRQKYLLCVNAANTDIDFEWLKSQNKFDAVFDNQSSAFAQIALQGPKSTLIVSKASPANLAALKYFHFTECEVGGVVSIAARTGYTGEDGFEFFVPWQSAPLVWDALLNAGQRSGIAPVGLGARDSLRLEAAYPLHGHELGPEISALESGLGWIVKFDKGDFIGRSALLKERDNGLGARALAGFFIDEPGIARHGDKVFSHDDEPLGVVTSGTKAPALNQALGFALINSQYAKLDTVLRIEVRGRKLRAHVVKKPFYKGSAGGVSSTLSSNQT